MHVSGDSTVDFFSGEITIRCDQEHSTLAIQRLVLRSRQRLNLKTVEDQKLEIMVEMQQLRKRLTESDDKLQCFYMR